MMRTKFLFIIVLCLFAFNCKNDDDNNQIQIDFNNFEFTNDNNLFEADLFRFYLNEQIDIKNAAILDLNNQIIADPNNVELQNDLNDLEAELDMLTTEKNNLIDIDQEGIVMKRIRVPPPPPCPGVATCIPPNLLNYISIYPDNDIIRANITFQNSETEEIIATTANNIYTAQNGFDNLIHATQINLGSYTGELTLNIERIRPNGSSRPYSAKVRIGQ